MWWGRTLWSMSVIQAVLAGHISFPSWEDSSCMKLGLAACRRQCVSLWLWQSHGRECAVHAAPSPWAGHGAESAQCLLGKTQFFSLSRQGSCYKCTFLLAGSSPSDELVARAVQHSQGNQSRTSNKAGGQRTSVTGWCPLQVLTNVVCCAGWLSWYHSCLVFWFGGFFSPTTSLAVDEWLN